MKFLLTVSQVATYGNYPFKELNAILSLIIGYDNFKSPAVQAHWQLLKGIGKRGDLYTWQSTAVKVLLYTCTMLISVLLLVEILDMYVCTNFSQDAVLGIYCTAPSICGYIYKYFLTIVGNCTEKNNHEDFLTAVLVKGCMLKLI